MLRIIFALCVFLCTPACATTPAPQAPANPNNSIVLLASPDIFDKSSYELGTGFVIKAASGRAITVTNTHVCDDALHGLLIVDADKGKRTELHILAYDVTNEICLLDGAPNHPPLILAKQEAKKNDLIKIIGHPQGGPLSEAKGKVADPLVAEFMDGSEMAKYCAGGDHVLNFDGKRFMCSWSNEAVALTAKCYPGNSGSPVLNMDNEVVGVVFATDTKTFNGLMIPVQHLRELISKF